TELQIALGDDDQIARPDLPDEQVERGHRVVATFHGGAGRPHALHDLRARGDARQVRARTEAQQGQAIGHAFIEYVALRIGVAQRDLPDATARDVDPGYRRGRGAAARRIAQLLEHAVLHLVAHLAVLGLGANALDEVLVAEALVERDEAHQTGLRERIEPGLQRGAVSRVVPQEIRIEQGQRLVDRVVGLAGAGRAEQDLVDGCHARLL